TNPEKVVERETEETTDKEQSNFQGSIAQIPPPVIPISIPEPDVPKTLPKTTPILEPDVPKNLPKPNIPYPSRLNQEKNFHTIIESLPTSTTFVEDSDSNREEIDIFSGPDDSIPPGIESDFDSEEDIIDNLLNDDPIPEYERLTFDMEPDVPVINNVYELNEDECFDIGGGEIIVVKPKNLNKCKITKIPLMQEKYIKA
ncbi:hypothetical protein Tco_0249880, partial [Tanacetum coccineum]